MAQTERERVPQLIKSLAHEISIGFQKLLNWPNRGEGVPHHFRLRGMAL